MFPNIQAAPAGFKARVTLTADLRDVGTGPNPRTVSVLCWDGSCTCGWQGDGEENADGIVTPPEECPRCGAECDVDDSAVPAWDPDDVDGWETGRF